MMKEKILLYIINILLKISSKLSIKNRTSFGRKIGFIMMSLSKKRRSITLDNLTNAFPDKQLNDLKRIMRESFNNLGIVFVEMLATKSLSDEDIKNYIEYENLDLIHEVKSRGKGVILLSGHYGNWEFLAYSAGMFTGIPATIIVKPQKNKKTDKMINEFRVRNNNTVVSQYKAARVIVNTIRKGETIALLADQSATKDKDVFVDFFGRPAATFEAPASLALKFGVPIIMGFAVRQKDGRYKVRLQEVDHSDLEKNSEGVKELTQRHVKILEEQIREHPGLWAWQHRRWKHKPVSHEKS